MEKIGALTPTYRDSAMGDDLIRLGMKNQVFSRFLTPNYLYSRLAKPQEEVMYLRIWDGKMFMLLRRIYICSD